MGAYTGTILDILEMYKEGNSVEFIAEAKGLSVEEVQKIIDDYA